MSENLNDDVGLRGQTFTEATFIAFVNEEIEKFKKHIEMSKNPDTLSFSDLNRALSEFSVTKSALLSLHALAQIETRKYTENFEDWYSERYLEIRRRENPDNKPAQKWAGQKEIERMVRVEHNFVFKNLKDLMDGAALKEAFLGRILDAWKNHQFILNRLCENLQSEVSMNANTLNRNFGE